MSTTPEIGALRVWHIPQVPGKPFYIPVGSPVEAKKVLDVLARYDAFQFENKIKPDYCNAAGLEVYREDAGEGKPGWCEWYCDDGYDIDSCKLPDTIEPIAEIVSASHDNAEFGERGVNFLRDFQHLEYGTKLYAHPAPQPN